MNSLLHITHAQTIDQHAPPPAPRLEERTAMRTSTQPYAAPVVREQPRPTPQGLGSTAW